MTWKKKLILIFFILTLLITACGQENVSEVIYEDANEGNHLDLEPQEGGQVIVPLTNFNTLNPLLTSNSSYYHFSKLIFEGLFDFDSDLDVAPKLAEKYFFFNDDKTISVELKSGVKWHDGTPFTTEDVAFTIDAIKYANREGTYGNILESNLGINPINFNSIINTRIIDERIIEISFDRAYLNNLEVLTFPIIPKHVFEDNSTRNSLINALNTEEYIPLGTGPYKFENYEKHKYVTLTKYDEYWDGSPNINEIIGKVLDDEELILTSFETGQIDFATTIGVDWDKYRQYDNIEVLEYVSNNYEFLGFNFNNELMSGERGQAIRKAIYYGINRQDIIHKVYLGHGTQIDVPLHPDFYLLSSHAYSYGYNSEMALKILNSAGFMDRDGDGILEDEEGNRLSLRLATNANNNSRRLVGDLIKDYLQDIGIEIILDYDTQYVREYDETEDNIIWEQFNNKINNGNYDIVLLGWQSSVIPNLYPIFHSSMIGLGSNFINYNNEEMDQILMDTLIDKSREEKLDSYEKLQKYIVEDVPYISLYFENIGLLVDSKIHGDLNPTFYNIYNGIENCYIVE
ncbi:MAG TPA: peptide ABC transporter substrate-binding protein [Tissierellaceae bacterium]|nr:peptide ABC transporter substrate-binding protein [Tissierellaceae bacterium]